jgi:hypothetical protein
VRTLSFFGLCAPERCGQRQRMRRDLKQFS